MKSLNEATHNSDHFLAIKIFTSFFFTTNKILVAWFATMLTFIKAVALFDTKESPMLNNYIVVLPDLENFFLQYPKNTGPIIYLHMKATLNIYSYLVWA